MEEVMKKIFPLLLFVLLLVPQAYAVQACWHCVPVEEDQTVCYVANWYTGAVTVYDCNGPEPQTDPFWETRSSEVLPAIRGYRREPISEIYYPSTIMTGHSSSFQAWWNNRINAPPGSGSSGPGACYYTTLGGYSSASETAVTSHHTTSNGVPYTLVTWYCATSGQYCPVETYIYGYDGE